MFHRFSFSQGSLYDDRASTLPATLSSWSGGVLDLGDGATHIGFVHEGEPELSSNAGTFRLSAGMYFSLPGAGRVGGDGCGISVARWGFLGFFQIGGPIEETGRMRYIDGCTDSLLVPPVLKGDPCLNLLHIPAGTNQTQHTHPSLRAGVIVSGHGACVTPAGREALTPGTIFVIPAESRHSFHTVESALLVVAYHPDSDTGPTHDDHPMINRTIVDGVSASRLPEIRT